MATRREPMLIGVDGGGSGCRVAIADGDLRIAGRGRGGPANPTTDFAQTIESVLNAVDLACAAAGVAVSDLADAHVHIGLAGIMSPAMAARVAGALPFRSAVVTDDRVTALAGALGDRDGCVAAIGTGSFAGLSAGRAMRFAGGWGSVLGDEASGAWLGRRVLGIVCRVEDGLSEGTDLTRSILASFEGGANGIATFAATARPTDFAALAPRIVAAAQGADAVAQGLMRGGADWIVRATRALGFAPGMAFCLTGGLGPAYLRWLPEAHAAAIVPRAGDAVSGALRLARSDRPLHDWG